MATIADSAAEAIFHEAGRRVGLCHERVTDILTTTNAAGTIEWNDGGVASDQALLQFTLRACFVERGWYDEKADQFIAMVAVLQTGIIGDAPAGLAPE